MFVIPCPTREAADLTILVLASQGIDVDVQVKGGNFSVLVDAAHRDKALEIIDAFMDEKPDGENPSIPRIGLCNWAGVVFVVLILFAVHGGSIYFDTHSSIILAYGASALYILQGEYFRTFTALMLHADLGHLAGNAAGILILGIPVCSIAGTLTGLLLIFMSGALGNLMNAYMFKAVRLSIGASTAVMGAAGILAAFQLKKKFSILSFKPAVLFPLGAGAALVGMLSGGENTDVPAHVFGFICGIFTGFLFELIQARLYGKLRG